LFNVPLDRRMAFATPLGKAMRSLDFERKQARRNGERPGLKRDERYYERGTKDERERRLFPYPEEAGAKAGAKPGSIPGSNSW
jgi:hypothetical protein